MAAAPRSRSPLLDILPGPVRRAGAPALRTETANGLILLCAGMGERSLEDADGIPHIYQRSEGGSS